jgi:hypothetical protein
MSRRHADPVQVTHASTPDGPQPSQFLWRDRLYVVREVLGRWVESGGWWRGPSVRHLHVGGSPVAPAGEIDDREREIWRVEAGRAGSTGVFDLVHCSVTGGWTLHRVMD